jgi:hypothetical protein
MSTIPPSIGVEIELSKESVYHSKVQNLLHKHKGLLLAAYYGRSSSTSSTPPPRHEDTPSSLINQQYAAERSIIDRIVANERYAFLGGLTMTALAFASLRYGPGKLLMKLNPEKARQIKEAEALSDKTKSSLVRWTQKSATFMFESMFGIFIGYRIGYTKLSSQTNEVTYGEIAKLPLCEGRSRVCEQSCSDVVSLVHNEIPDAFWNIVQDEVDARIVGGGGEATSSRLRDPERWQAIRSFADNCVKRQAYEESFRKRNGLSKDAIVDIPVGGVPQ